MSKLKVEMVFLLDSPYHVSADRVSFGVDRAIYIDPRDGKAVIPATSLKGVLRYCIEGALRARNIDVCEAPMPDRMCPRRGKDDCVVCKVFGSPRLKSRLVFQDIRLDSDIDIRMGVGIERRRRTAKEEHLFSFEVGYGKQFSAEIKGVFTSGDEATMACALLFLGANTGFALGGGKSRGLGWVKLKEFRATIDGSEIPIQSIKDKLKEVLA